jgi:site-specific recombinase XerD
MDAANTLVKDLRQLFRFAVTYDLPDMNLARDVELLKWNSRGYHSWTRAEIEKFEDRYPEGTTERSSLYAGATPVRSGVVRTTERREGLACVYTAKGKGAKPGSTGNPDCARSRTDHGGKRDWRLGFLVNAFGRPFTNAGFGNRLRKWCDDAGLKHCAVHGLRKAAAIRLAQLRCTDF